MKDALDETLLLSDKIIADLVAEIIVDFGALYKASEAVALLDMLWGFAHISIGVSPLKFQNEANKKPLTAKSATTVSLCRIIKPSLLGFTIEADHQSVQSSQEHLPSNLVDIRSWKVYKLLEPWCPTMCIVPRHQVFRSYRGPSE